MLFFDAAPMRALPVSYLALLTVAGSVGCASVSSDGASVGYGASAGYGAAEESRMMAESAPSPAMAPMSMAFADSTISDDLAPPPQAPPPPPPQASPLPPAEPEKSDVVKAAKRLVIYTGSIATIVPQLEPGLATFVAKINADGGYLQNRNGNSVTVRIPANSFFSTIEWLRKNGQVTDENVNAVDVTKQVFDLELRLQTADASRTRLLKLLETATKMEDILKIEAEVRRLTNEIEGMKGELRNLGDQIAFSTLTVNFFADAPPPNPYPQRTRSRFEWVNQVGVERVLGSF